MARDPVLNHAKYHVIADLHPSYMDGKKNDQDMKSHGKGHIIDMLDFPDPA